MLWVEQRVGDEERLNMDHYLQECLEGGKLYGGTRIKGGKKVGCLLRRNQEE